jgi:hypothetical protein
VSPSRPSFPPQFDVYPRASSGAVSERLPSRTNLISSLPGPDRNSRPFNRLRPLELSCLSFGHSYLLFSITCSLFLQNTQGGGTPSARCLNDLKSPSRHSAFPCPLHRHSRVWDPCFTHHSFTPIFEGSLATRLPRSARGRATFFYLPLESTLVNVQQNKGLYPPLESTLMQNRGRGSRLSPLVLIHTFNLSEACVGSISRSARFLPHAPARYMLGASLTMRFP